MARGDQLSRQWSLLIELTRGRRSRRSLADQFGVSLKTIARDIDALSQFPISEQRDGIDVFYHCPASARPTHIAFTGDEVTALVLGKDTVVRALDGTPFAEPLASALTKVERLHQDSAFRRAKNLPDVYQAGFARPDIRTDHQDALVDAALSHRRVWMRYFTAARQAASERVVEPYVLHLSPYGLQLIAYCLTRHGFVNFNVNLIEALRVLDDVFDPAARTLDRDAFLDVGFDGLYSVPVIEVHLVIRPPTAHWARDRFFHPTQTVTGQPDGSVIVTFVSGGAEAIAARVLSLGPDCEVVEPASLRHLVRDLARAIAVRYS